MGGKRPDQHNIAPSEAGTTDYKRYPEATHGQNKDLDTEGDKQRLAQSRKDSRDQPFLPDVPSPSAEANRGQKLSADQTAGDEEPGAADTDADKENPLV